MNDKFYFQGKWFETSEEMFDYVKEWTNLPLDQETAERTLDHLKKDITMNIFLHGIKFTNVEFSRYVENIFEFSMLSLHKDKENDKSFDASTSGLERDENLKNSPILDKQVLDILEETYHKTAG